MYPTQPGNQLDISVNSPVRQQPTVLRYVSYPPAERDRIELGRVDSIDQDPAMVRIDQAIEAAEERVFPEPLSPISATHSARPTSIDTASSAKTCP